MIELERSRADLLAAIGASAGLLDEPAVEPGSPELLSCDEVHFEISAHTRDEILPIVRDAIRSRFDWVSEGRIFHDLLLPLKRGLGNAFKRGNDADAGKWIRARVALTRFGTYVEIQNEGEGFDVEGVCVEGKRVAPVADLGGAEHREGRQREQRCTPGHCRVEPPSGSRGGDEVGSPPGGEDVDADQRDIGEAVRHGLMSDLDEADGRHQGAQVPQPTHTRVAAPRGQHRDQQQ